MRRVYGEFAGWQALHACTWMGPLSAASGVVQALAGREVAFAE
jgi:hypothetical protein